jgi:phospholipid/cholesterol/gamma-HCH transport system permease protein
MDEAAPEWNMMQEADKTSGSEIAAISQAKNSGEGAQLYVLSGEWQNVSIGSVVTPLETLVSNASSGTVTFNLEAIGRIDTAGAWLLRRSETALRAKGVEVQFDGDDAMRAIITNLPEKAAYEPIETANGKFPGVIFDVIGRQVVQGWEDFLAGMYILGSAVRGAQMKFGRGGGVSPAAIVSQIDYMGVRAVPIIALMSFLIGAIIAQQGAFQLRYFGAEVFVVDLVSILQLREVGVLLTAIMIAGRSGSAITAEIGSMKMREEIDALKVIGLNPVGVLVFPRLVALTIALPLLTIIANFSALFGASVVTFLYSGITFEVFLSRLNAAVEGNTIAAGMIKAPFMALIIGIVAAIEGMKVGGSAESLGKHVTAAVVKAIFVVILVDGLFAVFYAAIEF